MIGFSFFSLVCFRVSLCCSTIQTCRIFAEECIEQRVCGVQHVFWLLPKCPECTHITRNHPPHTYPSNLYHTPSSFHVRTGNHTRGHLHGPAQGSYANRYACYNWPAERGHAHTYQCTSLSLSHTITLLGGGSFLPLLLLTLTFFKLSSPHSPPSVTF